MKILALNLLAVLIAVQSLAGEAVVLDNMDTLSLNAPKEKARVELVDGKEGKAVKLVFDNDCRNTYIAGNVRASSEWDKAAGFSFWVKGDGSDKLGGIQFIWNEDYALRYAVAFPINITEWTKVTVAWQDLVPETAKPGAIFIDAKNGNAPSKLGRMNFGKWWYWKDYGAHSYCIDDVRLENEIKLDATDYSPKGGPLARVYQKLKAGKPVTIVTMGDSLTDYNHWANKPTNWPTLLADKLKQKYGSQVTVVNPAIGGTELRNNLVLLPRWLIKTPEPDLVTICFGYNDWESGMRGPMFLDTYKYAVDLIRRATKGKADILIITTAPAVEKWDTMAELAQACRDAASAKKTGIADIYAAFHNAGKENKERLYCTDKTHLGPAGHDLVASTVIDAIEKGGK